MLTEFVSFYFVAFILVGGFIAVIFSLERLSQALLSSHLHPDQPFRHSFCACTFCVLSVTCACVFSRSSVGGGGVEPINQKY